MLAFRFTHQGASVTPEDYMARHRIGGWIVLQIVLGASSFSKIGESGGVAYLAHVGGAVTGILVAFLFQDRARYVKARNEHDRGWSVHRPDAYD